MEFEIIPVFGNEEGLVGLTVAEIVALLPTAKVMLGVTVVVEVRLSIAPPGDFDTARTVSVGVSLLKLVKVGVGVDVGEGITVGVVATPAGV